jgi:hypothetical protein
LTPKAPSAQPSVGAPQLPRPRIERCGARAAAAVGHLDCRPRNSVGSGHRCQRRFDPSVIRGPGRPSRCAGWLRLVWRPRLGSGNQLGAANWASPGRQRTHMGVGNSQSGSANGPRRDLQNTQDDAITTPTGTLRSRHRRLPIYTVINGKPLQVSPYHQATLRRRLRAGSEASGGLARRGHDFGEDAVLARLCQRRPKTYPLATSGDQFSRAVDSLGLRAA